MCGIIGSINGEWKSSPLESISQRGPDFSSDYSFENLYLGHTRLSIIDTSSAGHQPMFSEKKDFVLVFNGEIYNHLEIRKDLARAHNTEFSSGSDTETLLKGWMEEGEKILERLNGIFSFAIFDKLKNCLTIVRDPFGVKPLYVYQKGTVLAFSSEAKSFALLAEFDGELNLSAIGNYLSFLWSPGEDTMNTMVKKLLPGHLLRVNLKDRITEDIEYFDRCQQVENQKFSETEWIEKVDEALNNAVKRQMLSDVPLGFFLSGGLDSSLLVAIAKKQNPNKELECFTINTSTKKGKEGFEDDLPYARKVADYLKVNLNEVKIKVEDISRFDEMVYALDEPQADLAPENVRLICHLAKKKGIKVLIGGAAGDDLFSGYRRHHAILLENKLNFIPNWILKFFKRLLNFLPAKVPLFRRLIKLSRDWGKPTQERLLGYFNWLPKNGMIHDLVPGLDESFNPNKYGEQVLESIKSNSLLQQMLLLEQSTFLVDHNLNYTDKLSMLEGVESRVPFLDFELVKLANQIPDTLRIKNGEAKYILKKVAEKYLPKEVIYRSKTGFGAPVRDMISSEFKPLIKNYLNQKRLKKQNLFSPMKVQQILSAHDEGKEDYGYTILSLLAIQSWLNQFSWSNLKK